jgi:prevent-host-death family protein
MRTVSARDANQQFSKILKAAAGGEEVTITQRGVPVAKLVPVPRGDAAAAAERERRKAEALAFFEKGIEGGKAENWTREELYLERFERPWEPQE